MYLKFMANKLILLKIFPLQRSDISHPISNSEYSKIVFNEHLYTLRWAKKKNINKTLDHR